MPATLVPADPWLAAAETTLDAIIEEVLNAIRGLPDDAVTWKPDSETNPVVIMLVHGLASMRSWIAIAVGADVPVRDRDAEFSIVGWSAEDLVSFIERVAADCRHMLGTDQVVDWGSIRKNTQRPGATPPEALASWALMNSFAHLREHVGEMHLTLHLWRTRTGI
jgi:hypothetical protein